MKLSGQGFESARENKHAGEHSSVASSQGPNEKSSTVQIGGNKKSLDRDGKKARRDGGDILLTESDQTEKGSKNMQK